MKRNSNDRMKKMQWYVAGRVVGKHLRSLLYSPIIDALTQKRNNAVVRIVVRYSAISPNFTIISDDNPLQVSVDRSLHPLIKFRVSDSSDEFQCSECLKYFFSMELLRNHQHVHVNRYKCTMCDMTTSSPSGLAQHVRYRHVKAKPFACSFCDYG